MKTFYEVRDHEGVLHATHERVDRPDGTKDFFFLKPDGTYGLGGRKRDTLPLYGSDRVGDAPVVIVTEGEKAADILTSVGMAAVATVTGADGCPTIEALAGFAPLHKFICWPDFDVVGLAHMHRVGTALLDAGSPGVLVVDYQPKMPESSWPSGTDAFDVVTPMLDMPDIVKPWVHWWVQEWGIKPERPVPPMPKRRSGPFITVSGGFGSVSEALNEVYPGMDAVPNKNVKCPKHDDRHASLHVLPDDERAFCHAASCEWSGRGVIASDVRA